MQDKVIGRTREDRIHASGASPVSAPEIRIGCAGILKVSGMAFRQNPHFKGEPCGVGRDRGIPGFRARPAPLPRIPAAR